MLNVEIKHFRGIIIIIAGVIYFGVLITEEIMEQSQGMVIQHIFRDHISMPFILPLLIIIAFFYEKQRSLQVKIREKEAEKLEAMKRLGRSVGQDLKNPLETIKNAVYVLQHGSDKKSFQMVEIINGSIDMANSMLEGFMDFETEAKLQKEKTDLNILIKTIVSNLLISDRVKTTFQYGDIPQVNVDEKKMKRAILNLIQNALQALPEAGELIISTKKTDTSIELSIQDTGKGITEENIEKIFTPFYTTKEKGIGLGLVSVKRIVDAHNGSINVKSQEGKGSIFTIKLPIN